MTVDLLSKSVNQRLRFEPVVDSDFETMLALRIDAMRPSLERVGRFSFERSRERLTQGFVPAFMQHIVWDGERIGFVTLKPEDSDALRLDHLYLRHGFHGQGIGALVLQWAQEQARARGLGIKLTALQLSDANRFYLRHGFVLEGEEGVDVHYRWQVMEAASSGPTMPMPV